MPVEIEFLELDQGQVLCVTPLGVDTFHEKDSFPVRIEKAMTLEVRGIIVDCGRLDIIDSIGLGALTGLRMKVGRKARIVLVNMIPIVQNVLRTANMHKVFDVFPSRALGMEYLKRKLTV